MSLCSEHHLCKDGVMSKRFLERSTFTDHRGASGDPESEWRNGDHRFSRGGNCRRDVDSAPARHTRRGSCRHCPRARWHIHRADGFFSDRGSAESEQATAHTEFSTCDRRGPCSFGIASIFDYQRDWKTDPQNAELKLAWRIKFLWVLLAVGERNFQSVFHKGFHTLVMVIVH